MSSSRVRHPILRLEVLAPDGTSTSQHRVFCRLQRESVEVEQCCGCVHCDAVTDGPQPSVDCSIPGRPLDHTDDPAGESVDVAAVLCRGTVVVSESAPLTHALRLIREHDRRSVAVVDSESVLVGVVHDSVRATMSTALAVHERTPVRMALRLLAANHLREATVVSTAGVPIGTFRDIDGLRWIAGAKDPIDS